MIGDVEKLVICAVVSVVAHAAVGAVLEQLPPQDIAQPRQVHVTVMRPDVPPPKPPEQVVEQPKPVEPPKPKPIEQPKPVSRPQPHAATTATPPPVVPPPPNATPSPADTGEQVFDGGAISSTSTGGTGPALSTGTGGGARPAQGSAAPQQAPAKPKEAEPVPDYAVSTPPLPQGRCAGKYTDDAKSAGVEGVVLMDIVVGDDGRVRDVRVTQGLGHGLDEAAVAALRACRFSPGEQDGKPVAVKIRGFKVRFALSEAP